MFRFSGFVVVLSFGDSEGVDFSDLILNHVVLDIYILVRKHPLSVCICKD